jgi:hypothetical protein
MIKVSETEYINEDHIIRVSVTHDVLQIFFSTGESYIIYDKRQKGTILKYLNTKSQKDV